MAERGKEQSVPVSISLPKPVYALIEYAARQKGIAVSEHIRAWILGSLEPWEDQPLPLDAIEVIEIHDEGGEASDNPLTAHTPVDTGPRREDFESIEVYLRAEKADRQARALATRKRNREAQPKVMADHIKAIAEARNQHPDLALRPFAQLLFDEGIYESRNVQTGHRHPVNSATLCVWLKDAEKAGLLKNAVKSKQNATLTVAYGKRGR